MSGSAVYDAIVIGGGPAGSAVSRLLALWGHRVLLLARRGNCSRGLAESIPPSTRKLLKAIDVLAAVERARFPSNGGNIVWWGGNARVERFGESGDEPGFQVFRPDFDALLREQAAAAGVEVRIGSTARRVTFADEDTAVVEFETGGELRTARARFAADCSGRTGVIGRAFRLYEPGHRMQAFVGVWRRDEGWPAAGEDKTALESYEDGWAWSPLSTAAFMPGIRTWPGSPGARRLATGQTLATIQRTGSATERRWPR